MKDQCKFVKLLKVEEKRHRVDDRHKEKNEWFGELLKQLRRKNETMKVREAERMDRRVERRTKDRKRGRCVWIELEVVKADRLID